jgi:hypothetical protein
VDVILRDDLKKKLLRDAAPANAALGQQRWLDQRRHR